MVRVPLITDMPAKRLPGPPLTGAALPPHSERELPERNQVICWA
jgi:hypothetical protein